MVAPLLVPIFEALAAGAAYEVVNNYITRSVNPKGAPDINPIPTSKPKTATIASKKQNLANFAMGVSCMLSDATTSTIESTTKGVANAESISVEQRTKTTQLLDNSSASPLLTNQVFIKDSIDKLIDAINTSSLVTASVFGTLDVNLSVIGASLASISATLIDVSENYQEDLTNTGDTPYINTSDYYKMLSSSGVSADEVSRLQTAENAYIETMRSQGASYSDIKKALISWRQQNVPSSAQQKIDDDINGLSSGITYKTVIRSTTSGENLTEYIPSNSSVSSVASVLEAPYLEEWANSQKLINDGILTFGSDIVGRSYSARTQKDEYAITQTEIRDLDGNVVAIMKPVEIQAVKNSTDARLRTDMNNLEFDNDDFDMSLTPDLDLSKLFQFDKKSTRLNDIVSSLGGSI
ncbi:MAG: hypothetical protein PHX44_01685 [Sulfurimonas sp.]|uniref:hypothetical protein n=1 Tax=Sulfurimonas sp. TaxID=2022749 RepID=UPI00260C3705|nr:hypothetical protein [Sulfurimonas sp.]MDD2651729.1 hypothetical protein [Sulfurimonas sp.]MDD2651746.1 hypothetical protein [Sulfurimonas sp.]MDD3451702.1 hypothetical protein [Sulfurimonas sp.]MDD3451719.1 hypothetical protein [Sulfurimonas sp.]